MTTARLLLRSRSGPRGAPRRVGVLLILLGLGACHPRVTPEAPAAPVVVNGAEMLEGRYEEASSRVASFRGIPYAAPPVGARRWQPPAPTPTRAGRQRAVDYAPACYQDDGNTTWYRSVAKAFGVAASRIREPAVSEDCLYLNVWTPKPEPGAHLPVMVWIHGGGNENGWSFEPNYQGTRMAAQGNVVVVTIAYRVNVFGFFSHPELSANPAPANFGLLDQIAALHWVKDHIGAFGGDPDNVTIFGESAGGANVGFLLGSPPAQGLFQRAISQSGGYLMRSAGTLHDAEDAGRKLAGAFKDPTDLAGLRAKSSAEILAAAKAVLSRHDYGPVIDGRTLTASPGASYRLNGVPVDLLIGSNRNEDFMYVAEDPAALRRELTEIAAPARPALEAVAAREPTVRLALDRVWTLANMACPPYVMAARAADGGHKAWVYRFSRTRPGPGGAELMVYHGSEIPYVFDTHDDWLPTEGADRALTQAMVRYWTNFARSGDPNSPGLQAWPRYARSAPQVLDLDARISAVPAPDHDLCLQVAPALYPGWSP